MVESAGGDDGRDVIPGGDRPSPPPGRSVRFRPAGPYSLLGSAGSPCVTRRRRGGVVELALDTAAGPATAAVRQVADGTLEAWVVGPDLDRVCEALRARLAVQVDLRPFEEQVADDPLLGPISRRMRGVRPLPLDSAAHALLRGVCGQLVQGREAHRMERGAARRVGRTSGDLVVPVTGAELRRLGVSELRALGLAERRGRALVAAARRLDLDGLAGLPTPDVVRRLCAQPGIGPWTAGVVCLSGLGRLDHGLVGDLGLMKLLAATGRPVEADETAALLDRYAPYQGLASVYLLAAASARIPASTAEIERARRSLPSRAVA